jgi:hypothetical protein
VTTALNKNILGQLAQTTLLPEEMSAAILVGGDHAPSVEDIVMALVVGARDCEAMTRNDLKASWNERRIARQVLTVAFLSALLQAKEL